MFLVSKSFSIVLLAFSLLIGLGDEIVIAGILGSIIKSVLVVCSKCLLFLPSLPMIFPFIPSFSNFIVNENLEEMISSACCSMALII
ncbi:Uncharacterised protein [Chlamydia trachomatis]|nr:Uncharacterised protein [Chlamydia trachomatis]